MSVARAHRLRRAVLAGLATIGVAVVPGMVLNPAGAWAEPPVGMGTAGDFSVLAGSTVTNTGATVLRQNLGVHPGNTAPGFPPGTVRGSIHLGDAVALQAKDDLTTAYNDAAGRTPFTNLPSELGGTTRSPGVYRIAAAQVTGPLTLNAQGDAQAVFIFQIASTLVTASNSSVLLINGAAPCNVYWQVGSSATIGTGSAFVGTIMTRASISMNTGATLQGRALAQSAAVTLDTNVISRPLCPPLAPPATTPPATPPTTPSATPPTTPSASATSTVAPTANATRQPRRVPAASTTPIGADSGGRSDADRSPSTLAATDGQFPAILTVTGTGLVVLGAALVIRYRRRTRRF